MKYFIILFTIFTIGISQDGEFSGVVYYQYSYDLDDNDFANYDEGFGINRVYLTYTQNLSEGLSYKFQTDINSSATPKEVYLKNAKVDWESRIGKITLGMQGMNVFNIAEKNWGFRLLGKSPMDMYGFSISADMGIGFSGKLSFFNKIPILKYASCKNCNYSLMITNGPGYKNNENDKYKKISTQFVYGEKNLIKNDGFNMGLSYTTETYDLEGIDKKTLLGLFGGYSSNGLRVGGEYDMYNHPLGDITETLTANDFNQVTSQIMAVYTSYKINSKLEGLVRYDMYDADTKTDKDGSNFMIAGLNYYPANGLIITPNVRITTPEAGEGTTHAMLNFRFKF